MRSTIKGFVTCASAIAAISMFSSSASAAQTAASPWGGNVPVVVVIADWGGPSLALPMAMYQNSLTGACELVRLSSFGPLEDDWEIHGAAGNDILILPSFSGTFCGFPFLPITS